MIEAVALLSLVAGLLSEAEDVRPAMRALGLGTRTWEPKYQVFFLRFSDDEPHWRSPRKAVPSLPNDLDEGMKEFLSRLVDHLSGRVDEPVQWSPAGWSEPEPTSHADHDDVERVLRHAGLTGWVDQGEHFLTIDVEGGWQIKVEGWGESCISEGVGPWSGSPRWRAKQGDPSCPAPDEEEFLSYCVAEALLRAQTIAEGEPDGPPGDAEEWVLDLWAGAVDPDEVFPLVSIQVWRTGGKWQKTKDGRLVGFRVARYDPARHEAISGADSRLRVPLEVGGIHSFPGRGMFLTNAAQHAIDHYAVHDLNVLLVYAFDLADHTGGALTGMTDTEISVAKGTLLEFQIYDDAGEVLTEDDLHRFEEP